MADASVRASAGSNPAPASASVVYTFPGTPVVGDPIGIWITTTATNTGVASAPGGWTVVYSVAFGTASRSFVTGTYVSGTTVTLTHTATPGSGSTAVVVVLNGSVHSGFGTPGTVTTRATTIATNTAVAAGTAGATTPNLVVSHEKAATHATAPTVSPTTTTIVNQINATASAAVTYVGSYDTTGGTASRTITYPTTSSNGAAYQVGLVAAVVPSSPRRIATPRAAIYRASTY